MSQERAPIGEPDPLTVPGRLRARAWMIIQGAAVTHGGLTEAELDEVVRLETAARTHELVAAELGIDDSVPDVISPNSLN